MKVNRTYAELNTSLYDTLYWYFRLTQPLNKLKNREIEVLTNLLWFYHRSKRDTPDEKWEEVFSYSGRIRVRERLGEMSDYCFNNHLSALRRKKVIIDNKVTPVYNPVIEKSASAFEMTVRFNIKR